MSPAISDGVAPTLDTLICVGENARRLTGSERNALRAPISRLHVELLSRIFKMCVPEPNESLVFYYRTSSQPPSYRRYLWLAFSHVCQFWRMVSINSSVLWTRPDFTRPHLAREMIARSRKSHLDIRFPDMTQDRRFNLVASVLLEALFHGRGRIEVLELHIPFSLLSDIMQFLVGPMPVLRSLVLSIVGNEQSMLHPDILGGQTPNCLTRFHLKGCHISWAFGIRSTNLTSLILDGDSESRPTDSSFYGILRQTEQLEVLELGTYALPRTSIPSASVPSVMLPALRQISLRSCIFPPETASCGRVLDNLSISARAVVQVNVAESEIAEIAVPSWSADSTLSPIFNSLSRHLETLATASDDMLKSLSISLEWDMIDPILKLQAYRSVYLSPREFDRAPDSDVSLQFEWNRSRRNSSQHQVFSKAIGLVPHSSISTLYVGYLPFEMDYIAFLNPLLFSLQLENLMVFGTDESARVAEALFHASTTYTGLAMPALRALTFEEVEEFPELLRNLVGYLDVRLERGVRLPDVRFDNTKPVPYEVLKRWMLKGGPSVDSWAPYEL